MLEVQATSERRVPRYLYLLITLLVVCRSNIPINVTTFNLFFSCNEECDYPVEITIAMQEQPRVLYCIAFNTSKQ